MSKALKSKMVLKASSPTPHISTGDARSEKGWLGQEPNGSVLAHLHSQNRPANSLHSLLALRRADSRASKKLPSCGCTADTSSEQVFPGSGALMCLFRTNIHRLNGFPFGSPMDNAAPLEGAPKTLAGFQVHVLVLHTIFGDKR